MPAPRESHADFAAAFSAGLFSGALPGAVSATTPDEAARRFAVYRNNVAHSLGRALAARYPVLERLLGEECFAALAQAFLAAHPPRSPRLFLWGQEMAAFLAAIPEFATLTYLPHVARLEWLRGEAYHAADATPLAPSALAQAASDAGALGAELHPSVRLFAAPCAAVTIWAANQPGATPSAIDATPAENALVLRDGADAVRVVPATPGDLAFVAALGRGETLLSAAQTALAQDPAHDAGAILFTLSRFGALTALTRKESP